MPILRLEALESRLLPTVSFSLQGSILSLTGSPDAPHNVLVRPTANVANSIDIVADGHATTFAGLTQVNYQSRGAQADVFTNRVATLPGTIQVGNGNVVIFTIAPGSTVIAGNGNAVIQATGGNSTITVGNGNVSVYGGPGDTITVGSGNDVVYDILPGNTTVNVAQHGGIDHLFTGPQTLLIGAQPQDHLAQFFVAAPLGSGTLVQQGSTLYYAGTNQGDFFEVADSGPLGNVYVIYQQGTGTAQTATFTGINQIAAFGGSGNDTFINVSHIDDVMYGAGGINVLFGGYGSLDLEKTGGTAAGGSIAVGNSPLANDLNGSGNTTAQNILIFNSPTAQNIARTNSPSDVIFGRLSALVTLYPDQIVAALLPPFVPA